jgi:hypothetical protein
VRKALGKVVVVVALWK